MAKRKYATETRLYTLPEIHTLVKYFAEVEKKSMAIVWEEYMLGVKSLRDDWDSFYPHLKLEDFIKENYD